MGYIYIKLSHLRQVGCDSCGKWRRLAAGASIDPTATFVCTMLDGTTCDEPEVPPDGQQMPSPRPWKMIRYFHSTVRNPS